MGMAIVFSTFTRTLIVVDTGTVIYMEAGCAQGARGAIATLLAVEDGGSTGLAAPAVWIIADVTADDRWRQRRRISASLAVV